MALSAPERIGSSGLFDRERGHPDGETSAGGVPLLPSQSIHGGEPG
jgi:hypothetical protein